ncbi:pyridoxamine 5'-phosphate oxidase family protein [Kitasatospora sp. NPDC097643]|uniref:pyridoxamine 5'-phosphate oxidase family protein n=1 Tax=Kitasatospora sp. NPDC097643 TaxID=3157230 RepID=UPI00332903C0
MSDESVRRQVMTRGHREQVPRRMVPLAEEEALRLVGSVPFGRVVFTHHALPAVRPVNHAVLDGCVVFCTPEGAAIASTVTDAPGAVTAYQVDAIDPHTRLGWSVVVTGYARMVTDPVAVARHRALLSPWVEGAMDHIVRISPEMVTGFRLVPRD